MNFDILFLLKKYCTARIDIKNFGEDADIIILNNNLNSEFKRPSWFNDEDGNGYVIESCEGSLDLKIKCVNDGELKIWLRGIDIRDKNNKRFPVYIDYTNFSVNGKNIFNDSTLIWHDAAFMFSKDVFDSEELDIHIEWLPFNENSEFRIENSHDSKQALEAKLDLREKQINSIPRLSDTTLGGTALNGKLIYRNWSALSHGNTLMQDFDGFCDRLWFTRFLKSRFPDEDFKINIFGVSNAHDNLTYPMFGKKVLYSMEDLNYRYLEMKFRFDKFALDYVDLAMGYEFVDNSKYLRFPCWMLYHFPPEMTEEEIENTMVTWNSLDYDKTKDVASISGHDRWGTRALIDNDINKFTNVSYAGRWKNNTNELWDLYNNDKFSYLKQYKFNLCAENLLADAYVSEKIFDAIKCDSIPLYAGGGNYLEPEIINPKAVLRWDGEEVIEYDPNLEKNAFMGCHDVHYLVKWVANDNQNSDSLELFKNLLEDEKTYKEFKDQDKVLDSSAKFIIKIFDDLEKQFERLIYD